MAGKKIEGPGIIIPRLKEHRVLLNKILRNDQISGSRRMLAMCLSMWMDMYEYPDVQGKMMNIIEGTFGDSKRTRFVERDEDPVTENQSDMTKNTLSTMKDVFDLALRETANEVSEP